MGNSAAPAYANIFMNRFEELHILSISRWKTHLKMFVRFIDDIFLLWEGPRNELNKMLTHINKVDERIQFTLDIQEVKITYLDVQIEKTTTGFVTDIYCKPTVKNTYHTHKF